MSPSAFALGAPEILILGLVCLLPLLIVGVILVVYLTRPKDPDKGS